MRCTAQLSIIVPCDAFTVWLHNATILSGAPSKQIRGATASAFHGGDATRACSNLQACWDRIMTQPHCVFRKVLLCSLLYSALPSELLSPEEHK
jgi:hypothetical protein